MLKITKVNKKLKVVGEIYHSVIHINNWYSDTEEMLIPIKIGEERGGYSQVRRLDRALTPGNRLRAYEEVI
jgi:hypothetical protein